MARKKSTLRELFNLEFKGELIVIDERKPYMLKLIEKYKNHPKYGGEEHKHLKLIPVNYELQN